MISYKIIATSDAKQIFACNFEEEDNKKAIQFLNQITRFLIKIYGDNITTNLYEERWVEGI